MLASNYTFGNIAKLVNKQDGIGEKPFCASIFLQDFC